MLLTLLEVELLILGTTNYSNWSNSSDSCYGKLQHHLIGNASINEQSGLSLP